MTMINSILSFFVTNAYADAGNATAQQPNNVFLPFFLVIFVLFLYITVWRPQNKRAKEQKELLNSLAKGDEVVTAGGMVGKINKITESYIVLSVSDTTEITLQRSSVITILPKGTLKSI
ncbi:MAG: preprotein translocase subunit YajC [Gammaproteobacteria bacterium]|nr:preprotein translocase subunit YajC [Gammaproteobacteria bacterium]